jgi:hypothetical protein
MQLSANIHGTFTSAQRFRDVLFCSYSDLFTRKLENGKALDFQVLIKALHLSDR